MKIISCLLAIACAFLSLPAGAENLSDWSHKKKISIDTSDTGIELKEGATQVPVALRLHTGNFAFNEAKPDGSDLRVAAADGKTPLHFHIESYDSANELAVLWVQLPKLAPSSKSDAIVMLWGNDKAAAGSDRKGSYDATQAMVLHFDSKDGMPQDATGNANHARESAATLGAVGPLGAAASFNGGRVLVPASPSLKFVAGNGFTFSAWVKPTDVQSGRLFEQSEGGASIVVGLSGGNLNAVVNGKELRAQAPLLPNEWQQIAVTVGGGKLAFYVNGIPAGGGEVSAADMGGDVAIGNGFHGDLDEVTLASSARSPDYIAAQYGSQQPDGLLLSFTDGEGGDEGASYIAILLGALTVDGWVVIGILAVMGVISAAVMIGKARFLNTIRRANSVFLDVFKNVPEQLLTPGTKESSSLASDVRLNESPIYRLYAIGLHEIRHRFEIQSGKGQPHALSAAALDSIRAAIDAGVVRELQRLNSQIVLLTIAISGGPFLGLLGTVVGVMITFAAIAAAGDVNVNSIAPGIAAALVATVAGLAVAIPALFGYNWLSSQIKNATADTQVFVDEFLTKAAELHSN